MEHRVEKTKISFRDIHKTFKYEHLAGGLCGGMVSTFTLHPLELIRIRFAVSDGLSSRPQYNSIWHCTKSILQTDGVQGMYRGANSNVLVHSIYFGLYFFSYNTFKVLLGDGTANPNLTVPQYLLCGCMSGSLTLAATNPLWTIRTRLCLEYGGVRYRGIGHALSVLYQNDGIKGLYKGFVPGLFGTTHTAIQFLVYEKLKHHHMQKYGYSEDQKLGATETVLMSGFSKFIAVSTTYPYMMLRARLQDPHRDYSGVLDTIQSTWKNETWRGFYKGLGVCLLRFVPSTCIMFYIYELVCHKLTQLRKEKK